MDKHLSQPSIELPPSKAIESPLSEFLEEQKDIAPLNSEKESKTVELAPPASASMAKSDDNAAPTNPPPVAIANDHADDHSVAAQTDVPDEAADIDVIEQIWVAKAKELIDKTKDDPHTQKAQMSKFKAEYIKKRINKEIKISED